MLQKLKEAWGLFWGATARQRLREIKWKRIGVLIVLIYLVMGLVLMLLDVFIIRLALAIIVGWLVTPKNWLGERTQDLMDE